MTREQVIDVSLTYERTIAQKGIEAKLDSSVNAMRLAPNDTQIKLQHVAWMCQEIRKFAQDNDLDRANRWLGFAQGVLWSEGLYTIADMREHNRSKA